MTSSELSKSGVRALRSKVVVVASSGGLNPLPSWNSGGFRVDIADRDALYRVTEEDA